MALEEQRLLQSAQEEPIAIDYSDAFAVAEGKMKEQKGNTCRKNVNKKERIKLLFCFLNLQILSEACRKRQDIRTRGRTEIYRRRIFSALPSMPA